MAMAADDTIDRFERSREAPRIGAVLRKSSEPPPTTPHVRTLVSGRRVFVWRHPPAGGFLQGSLT